MTEKKWGIIVCEDAEKWGGEDGVGRRFIERFKRHDKEIWEYFRAISRELPSEDQLDDYYCFILTGGKYSVHDDDIWMHEIKEFVRKVYKRQQVMKNCPKLVGVCLGHQIINIALGAKVINSIADKFLFTQQDISVSDILQEKPFYQRVFKGKDRININEVHGEEVVQLPKNAISLGSSENCENEIIAFGEKIFTMQGHMDFTQEEILETIVPGLKSRGLLSEEDEKEVLRSMSERESDRVKTCELLREFILDS